MVVGWISQFVSQISIFLQAALAVMGVSQGGGQQAELVESLTASLANAGYTCQSPSWETEPKAKSGSIYMAAMSTRCKLQPKLGGDFAKLQAFSVQQLKDRGQILTGPIDENFEGLPSQFIQYKLPIKTPKLEVTMWQDIHLATDGTTKFVSVTRSTKIQGKGNAEYLKKGDTRVVITKSSTRGEDIAELEFYTEVEKPWFAPEGIFVSKFKEMVPAQFAEVRDQLMQETVNNY